MTADQTVLQCMFRRVPVQNQAAPDVSPTFDLDGEEHWWLKATSATRF